MLVFRDEIEHALDNHKVEAVTGQTARANLGEVAEHMRRTYPDWTLAAIGNTMLGHPTLRGYLRKGEQYLIVDAHPVTGKILKAHPAEESLLRWLQLLHFNLLAGRTGRIVNGVGALFLLALCLTGTAIWWPGVRNWKRSVTVDFSRRWKRVNWDLHSATGFWTVSLLAMWALTGAYFAWPAEFRAMVNWFSPVTLARVPPPDIQQKGKLPSPEVAALLARSSVLSVSFPADDKGHIRVFLAREQPPSYENADYHYFDPFTGRHLGLWRRGISQSAGDVIMSWLGPLHFGTFGGPGSVGVAVKILWVILGLAPPLLMLTGFLMYWNRYLSKRLRRSELEASTPELALSDGA
jgi:uncharacterized iron-regulated membrane protein